MYSAQAEVVALRRDVAEKVAAAAAAACAEGAAAAASQVETGVGVEMVRVRRRPSAVGAQAVSGYA